MKSVMSFELHLFDKIHQLYDISCEQFLLRNPSQSQSIVEITAAAMFPTVYSGIVLQTMINTPKC